jgi:hypothetical protein
MSDLLLETGVWDEMKRVRWLVLWIWDLQPVSHLGLGYKLPIFNFSECVMRLGFLFGKNFYESVNVRRNNAIRRLVGV